jgi:predicted nucleic acid-binding protein
MTYAFDTNAVIHTLRGNHFVDQNAEAALKSGNTFIIPPFVYYEIRRGFRYRPAPSKEKAFSRMCSLYSVGVMDIDTWDTAARIYADLKQRGQTIEDADILIAAFCIAGDYTLVTHNTRHFERIDGLLIVDWME